MVICEVGVPPAAVGEHSRRNPDQPLRLCWSGLHLPGKALPLLLDALARLPRRIRWRLEILGAGPCTAKWHRYSRRIGIDANCLWRGQVQRSEALRVMQESHVFAITSVKDLTSTVLVEALAQGLPVVCPDHCGFADAIDESCGVKLAVGTPRQFIAALAEALERLHDDETLRSKLAAGAVVRARAFSWEHKAEKLAAIYAAKVGASAPESATRRAAVAHDGATVGA